MTDHGFVVALDGPAGAGKSSTARAVAALLGLAYVDTGALYRCVGLAAVEAGVALDDEDAVGRIARSVTVQAFEGGRRFRLGDDREVTDLIRSPQVGDAASKVSALPQVRQALIDLQRTAAVPPGAVVEGRDIGTVIFPDAQLKIFLDAEPAERARRRSLERGEEADPAALARTGAELAARDNRDSTRKTAPLRPAQDAILMETTRIDLDAVVHRIVAEAVKRGGASP
ncbi:MAG: cytidylate kinase [Hyphomicrobiaceae bacterium]|jgi:cytidylate kinase